MNDLYCGRCTENRERADRRMNRMPVIARQGFRCIDICELHRADTGGILQADFLFVKPALFDKISARGGVG